SRDTGVARTSWAIARSNDCCVAKSSVRLARDTALRMRRSGALTFAIGAHSARVRMRRDNRFIRLPPPARLHSARLEIHAEQTRSRAIIHATSDQASTLSRGR